MPIPCPQPQSPAPKRQKHFAFRVPNHTKPYRVGQRKTNFGYYTPQLYPSQHLGYARRCSSSRKHRALLIYSTASLRSRKSGKRHTVNVLKRQSLPKTRTPSQGNFARPRFRSKEIVLKTSKMNRQLYRRKWSTCCACSTWRAEPERCTQLGFQ